MRVPLLLVCLLALVGCSDSDATADCPDTRTVVTASPSQTAAGGTVTLTAGADRGGCAERRGEFALVFPDEPVVFEQGGRTTELARVDGPADQDRARADIVLPTDAVPGPVTIRLGTGQQIRLEVTG